MFIEFNEYLKFSIIRRDDYQVRKIVLVVDYWNNLTMEDNRSDVFPRFSVL